MTYYAAIIYGLLQGFTEFLPVSSSGHLRLLENFLPGLEGLSPLTLEIILHVATLGAVLVWLRREVVVVLRGLLGFVGLGGGTAKDRHVVILVIVASIPTAVIGLGLKRAGIEDIGLWVVALCLGITGLLNWFLPSSKQQGSQGVEGVTLRQAAIMGIVQGLAIFPGISRSGSTLFAGSLSGLGLTQAGRFSFLISVPAIAGATLLEVRDLFATGTTFPAGSFLPLAISCLISFLTGLVALKLFFRLLETKKFHYFAPYCWLVALATAIVAFQ